MSQSSRITHSDPKAEYGAFAVAWAARSAAMGNHLMPAELVQQLTHILPADADELITLLESAIESVTAGNSTVEFAANQRWQKGVTGYTYQTVPIALHACWRHPTDFRQAVIDVIKCGGDTDSTAAIVGGILGASLGKSEIPTEWLTGIKDWPMSIDWLERLALQLARVCQTGQPEKPLASPFWKQFPRNLFFLCVVIVHVIRRMLPPY